MRLELPVILRITTPPLTVTFSFSLLFFFDFYPQFLMFCGCFSKYSFSLSAAPVNSKPSERGYLPLSVLPELFLLQYEVKNMQSCSLELSLRYSLFLSEGVEESASDT